MQNTIIFFKFRNISNFVVNITKKSASYENQRFLRQGRWRCFSTSKLQKVNVISSDFIVSSGLPPIEAVTGVTIPEFVWNDISVKKNAPALECGDTGFKLTHGDVYRQSRNFAAALISAGVKRGDVISIILLNRPEYSAAVLGILEAGAIVCPTNPNYTDDELFGLLKLSGSKMIITSAEYLPAARRAKSACPNIKSIILVGEAQDGCHTFGEMVKVNSKGVDFLKGSQINTKEEVAILPFSSGTTGLPKAVELTHSNLCSNLMQFAAPDVTFRQKYDPSEEQERWVSVLPFFHMGGMFSLLANHYTGTNSLCVSKFIPDSFVKSVKEFKPTILTMVPSLVSFVSHCPDLTANDFHPLICVRSGAAPCGIALSQKLFKKVGKPIFFQEVYGLTEVSTFATIMNPSKGNSKLGSCGTLVPGTTAKVIDVDTGKSLGPKESGEICVKGPQTMKGYLKNPEATRITIDPEGWLHTGDIGHYDEEGCFYIVDRLKDLIKVKGLQVAPAELEGEIRKHPDVLEVAVIGIPDERSGELPRAYIVRKSDTLTESAVNQFLEGKISDYKQLKGGIEFLTALPKSPVGKVLRRELKRTYVPKI